VTDARPLPTRALAWVTWGLTFHILAVALLFGLFHLPTAVVRGIAAWKEIAGVLLLIVVALRAASGRGPRVTVCAADVCAGGWVALTVMFFLTENVVWHAFVPMTAALFGLRDASYFVIFYFIGRATPDIASDERWLKRAFLVLVITCAVAVLEQIFITPQMLVVLGVASYVRDFLGTELFTQNNVYGLPDNYWSLMGGHLVRRSGSVFLSSQGFAVVFLVLLPPATLWMLEQRDRARTWAAAGYLVIWAGLLATFTRAAIGVSVLQLGLILAARRRVTGIALAATLGLVVCVAAMIAVPGLATFVLETLTFQTGSSASHVKDWTKGITAFLEQPWGHGLGTTDQSAVRAGLDPLTADNLYLKYAVEMGVFGFLALVGTLGSFMRAGAQLAHDGDTASRRALGSTVFLATLGVALYGMTAVIFSDPIVAYLLFWFSGSAVTLAQRAHAPAPALVRPGYA